MSDAGKSDIEKYVRGDITKFRNNTISLSAGTAVFFFVALLFNPIVFVSLGAGLGVFVLLKAVLPEENRKKQKGKIKEIPGITYKSYKEYLEVGHSKLEELKSYMKKIPYGETKEKVKKIAKTTGKILDDLEENPAHIKKARQFLNYHLDAFNKIMKRYVEISSFGSKNKETNEVLKKVEESLDKVDCAFQEQLIMLHDKNVLELDVELSVLKKIMEMDKIE